MFPEADGTFQCWEIFNRAPKGASKVRVPESGFGLDARVRRVICCGKVSRDIAAFYYYVHGPFYLSHPIFTWNYAEQYGICRDTRRANCGL